MQVEPCALSLRRKSLGRPGSQPLLSLFSATQRQCQERPIDTNTTVTGAPALEWVEGKIVPNTFDRITQNPNLLAGRATIRGLRISVAHVINLVANGMTPAQIVEDLPDLEEEDIRQALAYAAALAQDELHPFRA